MSSTPPSRAPARLTSGSAPQPPPPTAGPALAPSSGQVWKKVKCDGGLPSCRACQAAGVPCVVSARLRRRTKIRGFNSSVDQELATLRVENEELRSLLQAAHNEANALRAQVSAQAATEGITPGPSRNPAAGPLTFSGLPAENNTLIIRHMGRLVPDCDGVERFAGSTTGVHFVLSVQQALHQKRLFSEWFPENCFRMHVIAPPQADLIMPKIRTELGAEEELILAELVGLTPAFINERIRHFASTWSFLCPTIPTRELSQRATELLATRQFLSDLSKETHDHETMFQLVLVLLITELGSETDYLDMVIPSKRKAGLLHFAETLLPDITARGQLSGVQCLVLLSLFYQLTGQHSLNINIRGTLLQMAQSLGLHRHSRRFKFLAGEVEMRKRLWWYIYTLDKMVAIIHGLPQTINNADVDVDFPVDGELEDMSESGLTLPLPGEHTPARSFIHLCQLSRILSSVLSQLYTTTERRGGTDKIKRLDQQLDSWIDNVQNGEEHDASFLATTDGRGRLSELWVSLMFHVTKLLIHRPGLTFESSSSQFQECLDVCTEASSSIIEWCSRAALDTIQGAVPPLPSLAFQCTKKDSPAYVNQAVTFLKQVASLGKGQNSYQPFMQAILDSVELLRSLSRAVLQPDLTGLESMQNLTAPAAEESMTEQQNPMGLTPGTMLYSVVGDPALESINQFDSLSWIFDDQLSPFINTLQ